MLPEWLAAGLILGLVNGFSGAYGTPEWTNAYTFGLMIVILILPATRFVRRHHGTGD